MEADRRPRAFTLVEILVAAALFTGLAFGLHALLVQGNRQAVRLQGGLGSEQDLRIAMLRLSRQLQEAVRIVHPVRPEETTDGVGFVDERGEMIFFHLEGGSAPAEGAGASPIPARLVRSNLSRNESEPILSRVKSFRVTLLPPLPGKAPSCLTLNLSVVEKDRDNRPEDLHMELTRVFLRNLERTLPEN